MSCNNSHYPILNSKEDLTKIQQLTQLLFTSINGNTLAAGITDYWIDQVALKIDALSDTIFVKEKSSLQQLVMKAKQYSKSRNLLVGGNFENLEHWQNSRNIILVSHGDLFKGQYLELPPAVDSSKYPTYMYQKVDESKLKPYTRYYVSGFIAQAHELKVMVSRYKKEIYETLHIPYEQSLPISSDSFSNCCSPNPCPCSSCDGNTADSHFFSYAIDVGTLQPGLNPGIEFGFFISSTEGIGKLSNLEIVEARPLTAPETRKVQRTENMWLKEQNKKIQQTTKLIQQTRQILSKLYTTSDFYKLKGSVQYQDILNTILPELPDVYHWFMPDVRGTNYKQYVTFQAALERAFTLFESRNLIKNGDFNTSLTGWEVNGTAQIRRINNNPMLVLPHWDASVSRTISLPALNEDSEYLLRMISKGKGKIILTHGTEEEPQIEILCATSSELYPLDHSFYPESGTFHLKIQSEGNEFIVDSVEIIEVPEEDE